MMKDFVRVTDQLELFSGDHRYISPPVEVDPVHVEGFFTMVARERGKLVPGSYREGKNVWTNTGREFLPRLMSYASYGTSYHGAGGANPDVPSRDDRIRYIGFGIGTQPEVVAVSYLVSPIAYVGTTFLAQLGVPTHPISTTSQYSRTFSELELSISGSVVLTEAGLYTDGSALSSYTPGTRDVTLSNAMMQAPDAYKSFEPFKKTQNFSLEVNWQVRF